MSIIFPRSQLKPKAFLQQGIAIVSAVFLLVVLAGLGTFILNISSNQQIGSALDFMGAKSYQAARSGTEWGLYRALKVDSSNCVATTDIGVIDTMAVTVTCLQVAPTLTVTEAGMGVIYAITATACSIPSTINGTSCPGDVSSPLYVERMISVLVDTTPQ